MTTISHYFSGHSLYAYLGLGALLELADQTGVQIDHKPMDLHKVMEQPAPLLSKPAILIS